MTINGLNNYILHYLLKDKTGTAIMLTGEWGSGKTYYIENKLVPFLKEHNATSVVVSLYGLDDISMISKSIYMELRMHTLGGKHSETVTTGKVIAKNVIKNITGLAGINLGLSDDDLSELYESVNLKDKLLILEDVERSNINITNLLGYVNGLVERDGVKVLLVANENEILRKNDNKFNFDFAKVHEKKDEKKQEIKVPEEVKKYLRIKEKTISDTIQFNSDYEQAVIQIIREFDNCKLNNIFERNEEEYRNLSGIVCNICKKNLRTFIFAIQKTTDIIDKMNANEYEDDFYECLLKGVICLSANIKADEFPKWEGNDYLSTKLGSNDMPLMRFAYDYTRWQTFDAQLVEKTYEAYKDFRFFERHAEYKDPDLRILGNYAEETEEHVYSALVNIEKKLHTADAIGIHAYCKLAYYIIYLGSVVGFDYKKSCELMIKNAKGVGTRTNTDAEIYFSHTYSIEEPALKQEYEEFIGKLSDALSFDTKQKEFDYNPQDIEELYNDVCRNTDKYTIGHRFLSKYEPDKIIEMLAKSSSEQLGDFRGILFAVYRYAVKSEFDEKDIEAMKQLLGLVEEKCNEENDWDKIQMMQINWLKSNLNQFIQQMS